MKRFQPSMMSDSYGFWPFDSAPAGMSLSDQLKGLSEAQLVDTSRLSTFAKLLGDAMSTESREKKGIDITSAIRTDLEKSASRAWGLAKADPRQTQSAILQSLSEMQAIAAKQDLPKSREAVVTALKWVSANAKQVSTLTPKQEAIPSGMTPGYEPDGTKKQFYEESWFFPVAVSTLVFGTVIGVMVYRKYKE